MKPFLYQVASLFYEKWGAEVSRLAFVFPNRRTGLFLPEISLGGSRYSPFLSDNPYDQRSLYPVERKTIRRPDQYAFYPVRHLHPPKRSTETFDEFLYANHEEGLILLRNEAYGNQSLDQAFHDKLVEYFRTYLLVGGMPESVLAWTKTHDFNRCRNIQEDIILTYEDDFSKYKKRVNPDLLRTTMRGICHQAGEKLTYKQISADYQSSQIREALRLLTLAGIVTPVVATSGNGIPLDAEADEKSMKVLFLDPGLLLAVLQLEGDLSQQLIELILAGTPQELVNKGGVTEMVAGLEMMRYKPCIQRQKMFYWEQKGKSVAEIDYLEIHNMKITPIEIKSGTQGGMKSLWLFMREKKLTEASVVP